MDYEIGNNTVIRPYPFKGPFAYSLRCSQCRREVPHSQADHDRLRHSWNGEEPKND